MNIKRHGLTVGIERIGNELFLSLKVFGKLTHEDYQHFTPMVDSALAEVKNPKIKALVDITELEGWELRAAWDDFKFGLKHGNEFDKIALVGNAKWQEYATKVGGWFMSGETKYFEEILPAIDWLDR